MPQGHRDESGLTARERKLVEGAVEGKSIAQAGRDAGIPDRRKAHATLTRPDVRRHYIALMERAGLTDDYLLEKAREVLNNTRMGLTRDGDVVPMGTDPHAQVKGLELLFKLKDAFPNLKLDVAHRHSGAIVITEGETLGIPDPFGEPPIEGEARELTDDDASDDGV